MLTTQEIRKKLFQLPERFYFHYWRNEWEKAKNVYDIAITITTFCEIEERDKIQLYGNRAYKEEWEEEIQGEFNEEHVQKAYLECIRRNQTRETKPYPGIPENDYKKREKRA